MARLVLGAVGAGIGGFMGGSIGASIGWSVGAALGGLVDPPDAIKQQGPRLGDLKLQASSYGAPIPVVYGAVRVAGNVIWASEIRETATTTSEGGKGGPEVETTTYTYAVDVAISIGEGELVGVSRMWANNQLVANFSTTNTDIAESVVFYSGTETQLPDPTMEAALGVGRVPAYRGQAYIVFENLQLADYGNRVPNFEFEIGAGELTGGGPPIIVDTGLPAIDYQNFNTIDAYDCLWVSLPDAETLVRYDLKTKKTLVTRSNVSTIPQQGGTQLLRPYAINDAGVLFCDRQYYTGACYLLPSGGEVVATTTAWIPPTRGEFGQILAPGFYITEPPANTGVLSFSSGGSGNLGILQANKKVLAVGSGYFGYGVRLYEDGVQDTKWEFISSYFPAPDPLGSSVRYGNTTVPNPQPFGNFTYGLLPPHWHNGIVFNQVSPFINAPQSGRRIKIEGVETVALIRSTTNDGYRTGLYNHVVLATVSDGGLDPLLTNMDVAACNAVQVDPDGTIYLISSSAAKIYKYVQQYPDDPAKQREFILTATLDIASLPSFNSASARIPSSGGIMVAFYGAQYSARVAFINLKTMTIVKTAPTPSLFQPAMLDNHKSSQILACIDAFSQRIYTIDYRRATNSGGGVFIPSNFSVPLADIVEDLCERSKLSASQIDVTALEPYTVRGYALSRQASARANIAQLQQAYFFDAVESDHKIKFVPRTQRSVVTIDVDELGAYAAGGQPSELLEVRRGQEVELPSRVSVTYPDQNFDYQLKTQNAQRLLTASVVESAEALAVVLSADEARSVANRALYFAHIERTRFAFGTSKKYVYLEPTDVVTINGPNKSYIARLQTASTSGGLIQWEAIAATGSGAAIGAPTIISPLNAGAVAGVAFAYTILATNTPTSYSATGLPAGLTLNTSTGAITGTVAASGTAMATITATNASGSGKSPLTITTTASAVAPTITSAATINAKVGALVNAFLSATGTSPIVWAVTSGQLPAGLSLNASTGAITGTPTTEGTASFTVRAANGTAPNATLAMTAIVQASGQSPIDVVVPGATYAQYLDIPLLRDKDDGAGFYVALTGATTPWSGATVLQSVDGLSYTSLASAFSSAASGFATTQLGAGFNTNMIDEASSVTVYINGGGTLASITTDELLNGGNACAIGGEILCFGTATLVAAQTYRLSRFIRGLFGTEAAQATHPGGDAFVMLNGGGVVRVAGTTAQIGQPLQYKSITNGQKLNTAAAVPFTNFAAGLKPLSPVLVNASKQPNGDFVIRWTRRGRIDAAWRSTVDVPLGETVEEYDLELYTSGVPNILRRTVRVTAPTYIYTLAQQVADAGSGIAAGALSHRVYQISSVVGRGFGSPIANT
jgi:hypothetical protein